MFHATIVFHKRNESLSAGKHEVKMLYEAKADHTGKVSLFSGNNKVGEGTVDNVVPGKFSLSKPCDVGVHNGGPVARIEYASPCKVSDNLDKVDQTT